MESGTTNDQTAVASLNTNTPQGIGIGLRSQHYQYIFEKKPATPWFEILTDNYMADGGQPLHYLEKIRTDYPITFHGVGMSLGSPGALSQDYMNRLLKLKQRYQPSWISDHLCWSAYGQHNSNELLPLPYTYEAIHHMANKIRQAQDILGERLLIENVSSYVEFRDSSMSEWEFINAIVSEADCNLLLDINNIYVSAYNHGFNTHDFINGIDTSRVREMHLAGYEDRKTHLLDTHGHSVHPPVWALYEQAIHKIGNIPTLIEWDTDIPEFSLLEAEARKAQQFQANNSKNIRQGEQHANAA